MTNQIRAELASQVDGLIWETRTDDAANETATVRRDSLAAILPLVEDGFLAHGGSDDIDMTELKPALAALREALSKPEVDTSGDAK